MSATRDKFNVRGLAAMLGGRPPQETPQALAVAAAGAGGGSASGLAAWTDEIIVEGVALTVGAPYYLTGSGWSSLTSAIDERHAVGVCVASVAAEGETPASSTIVVGGEFARTGTAGAAVYADDSGALSETFPGDETDETTDAPWVWAIAWQISGTRAILQQCDPYRPRRVKLCATDGSTQIEVTIREYPPDPA
jgi:hypothetical protein